MGFREMVVLGYALGRWERLDAVWQAVNPRVAMELIVVTPGELSALSAFGEQILAEGLEV